MKKSSRIKLLLLCLIISIVSFAFACDSLGGDSTGGSTGGDTSADIVIDDYVDNGRNLTYYTYGEVKVDGIIDDEVWATQRKVHRELEVGGSNYAVDMSAYMANNGVVMYIQVETDGGVYVNPLRGVHDNSGVEVYISSGDKTAPQMNSWEIPLQATGNYSTGLYTWSNSYSTGNCYVDVKTQIDGFDGAPIKTDEVNLSPDETAGYTIEFYIPYSKLNEGTKPSSIAMTGAILHMASYNSTTRNWVDIHSACDGVSGFANIQNRYFFNEQGYIDPTVVTPRTYKVNGVEQADGIVENGQLILDIPNELGKAGSITAIPDAGYMFDYLIVNGVKQSIPYFEVKKNTGDLDIQVAFKSLEGVEVVESATITLSDLKEAPLGYTLEGKSVRLFSSQGIFDAEIVNNVVSFENVPAGRYTLSVIGLTGLDTAVVLEKDVADYTIDLEFTLFTDSSASYDEVTGTHKIEIQGNKLNNTVGIHFAEKTGEIVWAEMTVGFDKDASGVGDGDDILLTSISGTANGSTMDIGLWWLGKLHAGTNKGVEGKELRLRTAGNASWASKALAELTTASSTDNLQTRLLAGEKIQIAVSLSNGIATILYRMEGDTNWYIWMTLNNYGNILGYSVRSINDTISNIKVANTDSMFDAGLTEVSVSVNDDTMGSVVAKGSIYGGDIKVLPQPAEGYIVYGIQVNGVSYPFAAAEFNATGKEVILSGAKSFVNEVYVEFGPAVEASEYTLYLVDTNGNLINGEVAFSAAGHYSPVAKVIDGVVTVALEAGVDYVLTITGYTSATVSVSTEGEVAETTYILTKGILYTDSANFEYGINNEDGNWWTAEVKEDSKVLFVDDTGWADGKAISFHFDALLNTRQYPGIRFYDGSSYVSFQFCIWDGTMYLKICAPTMVEITKLISKGPERAEVDFKIYVEGSSVVFTMDGEFVAILDLKDYKEGIEAIDRVAFLNYVDTVADFKISQITTSEDKYEFVGVKVKDASDAEYTEVSSVVTVLDQFAISVSSLQILAGKEVTITVLPGTTADFETYFVKSITIDGVNQSFEANASGEIVLSYVVPAGATDVEIVVDTAIQQAVSGTMKVYLASTTGNEIVTDLSKVTFNGANLTDATVAADGTISFTMNTGIYAVEYVDGGYEIASLSIDGEGQDIVIYLNKVIFNAASDWEVSYDYNGEGVSLSKYTKNRSDVLLAEDVEMVGYTFKYVVEGNDSTRSFQYIELTDVNGVAFGYQLCIWNGNITVKPAANNGTVNGVENRNLFTLGQCKTGIFSADISFFAVGTHLYIIAENVISNGAPAQGISYHTDFSSNGTLANIQASSTAVVTERYAGDGIKNLFIAHNNDGIAGEAKYWAFENIEVMYELPVAEIAVESSADATVETSADTVEFGSSATITVTPVTGGLVKAVVVNGVEYPVAAERGVAVEYTLSSESLVDVYEVSAIVAADFASGSITVANGKTIGATGIETIGLDLSSKAYTLLAGNAVIAEGTLVGGVFEITDVPYGTYTVSIDNGNFVGEILINEAEVELTVSVDAVLFSSSEDAMTAVHSKISLDTLYTGDAIVYGKSTDKNVDLYFNEGAIGGKVVWAEQVVTLNAVEVETWLQGFGYRPQRINNGNYQQLTAGVRFVPTGHGENKSGSNEFQARFNDVSWTSTLLDGTQNKTTVTLKIVSWVENGMMTLRIYDYATGAILATQTNNTVAYEYISHIANKNNRNTTGEVVHSLKISTTIPGAAISTVDGENYTISTDKAVVKSGETVNITVTPDANNVLVGSVFVNGVAINPTFDNGVYKATWTNNDKGLSAVEITAVSTTAVAQEYTVDFSWKFANDPLYYGIADGKKVTFVGQYMTKEATIVDGAVTVELVAGDYEVILPDGTKTTFVATEDVADAATEINAIRSLTVADSLDKTVNADGTINVTGTKAGAVTVGNGTNLAGTIVKFNYSINHATAGQWVGGGIRIYSANGTKTEFNLLIQAGSALMIKNQTSGQLIDGSHITVSGAIVRAESYIMISEDGKTITIYMATQGKVSQGSFTTDAPIKSLEMGNLWAGSHTWAMDNIEVTDKLAVAAISYLPNDNLTSVVGPTSVNFGETASIVVKANEGYAIKSVSANGVALPIVNNEDGTSTISLAYNEKLSTNITIDIETIALSYQTLTINVSGVNYDGSAASIESVTLYNEDGVAFDVELVSGVGTIELLAGTYTLADIEGYFVTEGEISVVVAGEPVSMAVVVRESMFAEQGEGWVESYAEETGYSYTKSTRSRSDLLLAQDIEGLVGMSFTYELEGGSNTKTYPYIYLIDDAGVSVGYQLCVWTGNVILKPSVHNGTINGVENRSIKTIGSCKEGKFSADIKLFASGTNVVIAFTNVISNGQPAADFIYYEDFSVNGKLANVNAGSGVTVAERFNGTVKGLRIAHNNDGVENEATNWALVNVQPITVVPAEDISYVENEGLGYVVAPTSVQHGSSAIVTVKLFAGYKLGNVEISNATYTLSRNDDGSISFEIKPATIGAAIEVNITALVSDVKYAVNYTVKNDGITNPLDWADTVAEGLEVEVYDGEILYTTATIGADGALALELESGTYTVNVAGYYSFTIVVDGEDVVAEQVVSYKMFSDNDAVSTAIATGAEIKTSADPNFSANVVYAEMLVKYDAFSGQDKGFAGFKAAYTDGTYGNFEIQKSTSDAFFARACSVDGQFTSSKVANSNYIKSVYTTEGFKVAMAIVNGRSILYAQDANGNLVPCVYDSIKAMDTTKVLGLHMCTEGTIISIKTYTTLDNEYVQSIISPEGGDEYEDFVVGTKNTLSDIYYFDANEDNVITFDITWASSSGDKFFPCIFFNGYSLVQFCVWDGNIYLKPNFSGTGQVTLASKNNGVQTVTVRIKAGDDGRVTFYKVVNGQESFVSNFTAYGGVWKNAMMKAVNSVQFWMDGIDGVATDTSSNAILNGNPFAITNFNVFNSSIPADINYEENSELYTFTVAPATVAYGSSTEIVITPIDGSIINAVYANGNEIATVRNEDGTYTATLNHVNSVYSYEITVDAEAAPEELGEGTIEILNGNTIGATGIETIGLDLSSKAYSLILDGKVVATGTLVDGIANVSGLLYGAYTLSVDNGNFVGEFVVDQNELELSVYVDAVLFSGEFNSLAPIHERADVSNIYVASQDAIVYAKANSESKLWFNEGAIGGKIIYIEQVVTLTAVGSETWLVGAAAEPLLSGSQPTGGIRFVPQGHSENKSGVNEFQARFNNGTWGSALIPGSENATSITVKLVNYIEEVADGNNVHVVSVYDVETGALLASIRDSKTEYTHFSHLANKSNKNEGGETVHSLKLATSIPGADVVVADSELYTVSTDKDFLNAGESTVITVTPAENVLVTNVIVNGTLIVPTFENGVYTATYTNNDKGANLIKVSAVATQKIPQTYTLAVDYKAVNDTVAYSLEGATLTFVGEFMTKSAAVVDGKVSVELVDGDYTVTADTVNAVATFVATAVVEDAVDAITLVLAPVASLSAVDLITTNEDGTINLAGDKTAPKATVITYSGSNIANLLVTFDYSIDAGTGWAGNGVAVTSANGTRVEFNLLNGANTSFRIKRQTSPAEDGPYVTISAPIVDAPISVAVSADGKTVTIYAVVQGKTVTRVFTADSKVAKLEIGNLYANTPAWSLENIKTSDTRTGVAATYAANDELYTFTVAPATVAYGSTEIVLDPVEKGVITAVKANDVALPLVLNEDGTYTATITSYGFEAAYAITVEGEVIEDLATLTVNVSGLIYGATGIEAANMVGKTVTINGEVERTGIVAEDGTVVFESLPYGEYTATIANYTITSDAIVCDAEAVSADIAATYNLLSGGTVANQDLSNLYTTGVLNYNGNGGSQTINTTDIGKIIYAEMVVEHTVTASKTSGDSTGAIFGYNDVNGGVGNTGVNVGYTADGFNWRLRVHNDKSGNSEWVAQNVSSLANANPLKVIIAQAHVGTQVYAYVLDADTREILSSYKLAKLSNGTGIFRLATWFGDGTTVLSGIKLSTTLPESIINLIEGDTYAISSDKQSVALESTANVTIAAKEGYKVSEVKVTGATFSSAINDEGATVITVKANTIGKEISISVETEELTTLYNVALTLKNDGETNPLDWGTYVPENANANIYFGDFLVKTVKVGANGLIEAELEAGSYKVTVDNYFAASFEVVDADVAEEFVLVYKTLADTTGINEALSAGNAIEYVKANNVAGGNPGFSNTNVVYAETKFKTTAYGATEDAGLFGYKLKSNGEYIDTEIQNPTSGKEQVRSCNGSRLTWAASKAPMPAGIDDALIQGEGVTIAMAIIDNTPVFYVENLDGNLVPVYAFPQLRDVTSIFGYHVCRDKTTIIDIKTYTTLDNEYVQSRLNGLTDEVVLSGDGISGNNEDGYTYQPTAKNKSTNFTFFNTGAVSEIHYTMEWDNASTAQFFPNIILNGEEIQMCIWNGSFIWKWVRGKGVGSGGVNTGKVDIVIKNDANNHLVIYRIENDQEVLWYDIGAVHASTTDNSKKYGTFSMNAIGSFAFSSGGWDATSGPFDGSPFKITNLKFI